MSSEPLLSSQFCPELQRWLESVTALSCQLIGLAPGANRQLWTSKRLKLLLEHELLIAQPLSPQTQASHGASHPPVLPSPPPLNLLSCLSAPLLLLPPFPLQFFKHEGGGGFSPLLSAPPPFFLRQATHSITLTTPQNPPHLLPTAISTSIPMNVQSPDPPPTHPFSSAMGDCPGAEEGVKRRAAHVHTQFQAQKHSTPPHSHPSIVYMCVYVCAHLQRNTGTWWVTDERGGGVGWRPNGSQCRKWLVATQTAPESTVITGLIPVFYLHWENTRPLAAGQGQPLPPTNDYAKLFLQGKKIQLQPSWR